ncbi:MAG: phosphatase PAP2 family protein [Candidatus Acidiferrales bacterium]
MSGAKHLAVRIVVTCILVVCVCAFAVSKQLYTEALVDSFFAFALVGILILQFRVRPDWFDALLILTSALIFAGIDFRVLHYAPKLMAWFSFAGVSGVLLMGIHAIWTRDPSQRRMLLYAWVPAVLFVGSEYFAATMLEWTTAAHPKTLDLYLLSFDYSLRVELASLAGELYLTNSWVHVISLLVYVALAIPLSLVYAGRLVRFKEKAFPSMLAFLITGPVGILFYNLFPACGPHALFQQGFPFHPFPMAEASRLLLEPLAVAGPRNAIPSLHMAWALLAWWYSRGLSWLERSIAFAFLAVTAFATLGTGEHWFVDLIVAFPFALLIRGICSYSLSWKDARRLSAIFLGLFGTLLWLAMLRFSAKLFWTSPIVPWALAAATVGLVCLRQTKLDRAIEAGNGVEDPHTESVRVRARDLQTSAH